MAKSKKPKHIAVAGNIGAGKTTLTEMLSKHYRWIPQFEDVDHNPYLFDFYEDAHIFAANLHKSNHITDRDYQSYLDIFNSMTSFVQPPDLLNYLKADIPKLVQQIQKRNRDFEFNIKLDYLRTLNEHYEEWIGGYKLGKLLIIDVNNMDFVERVEDFSFIVGKIELELNSLFSDQYKLKL